jgi:cell wall assembly regulator SMI1
MTQLKLIDVASPLTIDDFKDIESRFGIVFPSSLKKHYLINNGGIPECYVMCYIPKGVAIADANDVSFSGFCPIKYRTHPKEATLEEVYTKYCEKQRLFDPHEYIPFGDDVSGYPFLMDFKNQQIHLLNREDETTEFVANSLEEFIDGLITQEEYEANN